MDGFFRILKKTSFQLFCTRLYTRLFWSARLLGSSEYVNDNLSWFYFHRLIRGHRKFAWARDWLKERMPKLEDQIEIAAIPILCCISENTWDIKEMFNVLFQPSFNVWITSYSKCFELMSNIEIFVDFWIFIYFLLFGWGKFNQN